MLLLRVGLLALAAMSLVTGGLMLTGLTLDLDAWFFGQSLFVIALMTACVCALAFLAAKAPADA